jgi:hypothetical protein
MREAPGQRLTRLTSEHWRAQMSPFGNDAKHSSRFRDKPGIASGTSLGQLTPAYASVETLDFVQT